MNTKAGYTLGTLILGAVIALAVFLINAYYREEPASAAPAGTLEVHVIDVGNADAILLRCDGRSMLIDAGENAAGDAVVSYIRREGVKKLDVVIATHPDADHIGGMDVVVDSLPVGAFLMPLLPEENTPTTQTYLDLLEALDRNDVGITEPEPGASFPLGAAVVDILGPAEAYADANNLSVVCRVVNGRDAFLFMGDAEKPAENALLASGVPLKSAFLKVGHHGSKTSTQAAFLAAVDPAFAVIPCGADNRYGHPATEVLDRLYGQGAAVFRSDRNGTVIARSAGDGIEITTEK